MVCSKVVDKEFKNVRLLVDIDYKPRDVKKFSEEIAKKMNFIDFTFGTVFVRVKCFETARGLHLAFDVVADKNFNDIDTIICQMALGSDYKRELFNYRRIRGKTKVKDWNILFKKKVKRGKGKEVLYISEEKETELSKKIEQTIMEEYLKLTLGDIPKIRREVKKKELEEIEKDIKKLREGKLDEDVFRFMF